MMIEFSPKTITEIYGKIKLLNGNFSRSEEMTKWTETYEEKLEENEPKSKKKKR